MKTKSAIMKFVDRVFFNILMFIPCVFSNQNDVTLSQTVFSSDKQWGQSILTRTVYLIRHLQYMEKDLEQGILIPKVVGIATVSNNEITTAIALLDRWFESKGMAAVNEKHKMAQPNAEIYLTQICEVISNIISLKIQKCGRRIKVSCCYPSRPSYELTEDLRAVVKRRELKAIETINAIFKNSE